MRIDESMMTVRVVLADDHALVRAGIRALIEEIRGVEVVAEASDGREALRLIAEYQPDLVFLDIVMPELNGFEVLNLAAKEFPHVRVIILTIHDAEEYAVHALRAGAAGYLSKSAASSEISLAIETVMRGERFFSPRFSLRSFLVNSKLPAAGHGSCCELTPRQYEVLRLIAEGSNTKHIALKLHISPKTVESHRAKLMERLDIHDVAGLVRYAIKLGLVRIDDDLCPGLSLDSIGIMPSGADRLFAGRIS